MQDILYNIFLYPFVFLFYFVLNNSLSFTSSGIALIILSIVINAIFIPISIFAKKIEVKERDKQKIIKEEVREVKKEYKGEEAFRKIEAIYKNVWENVRKQGKEKLMKFVNDLTMISSVIDVERIIK